MKRTITISILAALMAVCLLFAAGCTGNGKVKPSPTVNLTPKASPTSTVPPATGTNGNLGASIADFVEGATVEISKLPAAIKSAIEAKYPGSTIKTVTYTTYMNTQTYCATVQPANSTATETCYVKADGTLMEGATPTNTSSTATNSSK